jgi:hypothetical protein
LITDPVLLVISQVITAGASIGNNVILAPYTHVSGRNTHLQDNTAWCGNPLKCTNDATADTTTTTIKSNVSSDGAAKCYKSMYVCQLGMAIWTILGMLLAFSCCVVAAYPAYHGKLKCLNILHHITVLKSSCQNFIGSCHMYATFT